MKMNKEQCIHPNHFFAYNKRTSYWRHSIKREEDIVVIDFVQNEGKSTWRVSIRVVPKGTSLWYWNGNGTKLPDSYQVSTCHVDASFVCHDHDPTKNNEAQKKREAHLEDWRPYMLPLKEKLEGQW